MYSSIRTPHIHDIVFVQLLNNNSQSSSGNYVKLVEYENLEGLVLCTEITKYKSNLKSLVKPDEIFPVIVISTLNGYDLSYSKIKFTHRKLLKECYDYQDKIYKLIKKITNELNINNDIIDLILKYNLNPNIYIECYNNNTNLCQEFYNNILVNSDILFDKFIFNVDNIKTDFKNCLQKHLEIKPNHVVKEFKLLIVDDTSLNILKETLNKIKNIKLDDSNYDYNVECRSSPIYQYKLTHNDVQIIEEKIEYIDKQIQQICDNYKCILEIKDNYNILRKGEILFI